MKKICIGLKCRGYALKYSDDNNLDIIFCGIMNLANVKVMLGCNENLLLVYDFIHYKERKGDIDIILTTKQEVVVFYPDEKSINKSLKKMEVIK